MAVLLPLPAQAAPSAAELEQAGNLFAITCSSSFCHGEAGIGGRGPSLRNRDFTPDFVRNTILEGRSGTPMPSFKGALSPPELAMIVAYVMSLSPGNHAAETGPAAPPDAPPAPLSAQAARGRDAFFDETRAAPCGVCHTARNAGGPIGPDLAAIAGKSPAEIYAGITQPTPGNPSYPAITVTTRGGVTVTGIAAGGDANAVRLYDLGATPPVLRSFYKSDGATVEPLDKTVVYAHTLTGYSDQDMADIIAFLTTKDVTPRDLGLR
jgi:putative heme-binding domain-containing protein